MKPSGSRSVIEVYPKRGGLEWMDAQAGKVTESDVSTVIGPPRSANWEHLVERLFLDLERVPNAHAERLQAWRTRHEDNIGRGLAWYDRLKRSYTGELNAAPGLVSLEQFQWMACSPHGLTPAGAVHIAPHLTRATFEKARHRPPDDALGARLQFVMFITGRAWCDVVHVSCVGEWLGPVSTYRLEVDPLFMERDFLPAAVWLWQDVRRLRDQLNDEETKQ